MPPRVHTDPDVLAPWGHAESSAGVASDAGLMSNGPYTTLPAVWEWEYGDRADVARLRGKLWPLLKGQVGERASERARRMN